MTGSTIGLMHKNNTGNYYGRWSQDAIIIWKGPIETAVAEAYHTNPYDIYRTTTRKYFIPSAGGGGSPGGPFFGPFFGPFRGPI